MNSLTLSIVVMLVAPALAHTAVEWKSRTIYQLLTDRFALDNETQEQCDGNLSQYCGGSFKGVIEKLDYIKGMGFDAIWISPVVAQQDQPDAGYHGYWAANLNEINQHFGSKTDLQALVDAAHEKDIWVMVDIVVNHMGPTIDDIGGFVPFNQNEHYHDCNGCPQNCQIQDFNDDQQTQHCRLANLPDLDQSNQYVGDTLIQIYKDLVNDMGFDGIRMDTVPEVSPDYWAKFKSEAASDTFIIGEVFNGDSQYMLAHGSKLDSMLSYPMFFTMRNVFAQQQDMTQISSRLSEYQQVFGNRKDLLGTFVDNHDNDRFMNQQSDAKLFTSAIVFSLMCEGIPIVYYGGEQLFSGGNDPDCRERLWPSKYATSDTYKLIQTVNDARKSQEVWNFPMVERYSANNFYAFSRGKAMVALTNVGGNGGTVQFQVAHPYSNGDIVCNVFYPDSDCIEITSQPMTIVLQGGESKIFVPKSNGIYIK